MTADIVALKTLWQEAFGDSLEWLDSFFANCFSEHRFHAIWEDKKAVSALYWFDCHLENHRLAYIYAVATAKNCRGRGLATRLMAETHQFLREKGYSGAILIPGEKKLFDFYEKIGYRTATAIAEFAAEGGDSPIPLERIDSETYVNLRKQYLPKNGVEQGGEALALLDLYAGEDFLLAANTRENTLYAQELLGNTDLASQILCALNLPHGHFRTNCHCEPVTDVTGVAISKQNKRFPRQCEHWLGMTNKKEADIKERPFAMFLPLQENCPVPAYFGLALD